VGSILEIIGLRVEFNGSTGKVQALRGVDLFLDRGEAIALVGESGCGKSVTARAIMGLITGSPGKITGGQIQLEGVELTHVSEKELEGIRGREIGMVFQDPMTSLNPTMTVGRQIGEVLEKHLGLSGQEVNRRVMELMELAGIPNPEKRIRQYPHQFSGGMRQRAMIAMAVACRPKILIADEPTTALDVTIQAEIIELLTNLKQKMNTSIILITHDLGVVAGFSSRVMVMYAGQVVEEAPVEALFYNPVHPYTKELLKSVPRPDAEKGRELYTIVGSPPDLSTPSQGCAFWPRCQAAMKICAIEEPPLQDRENGHKYRCWLGCAVPEEVPRG